VSTKRYIKCLFPSLSAHAASFPVDAGHTEPHPVYVLAVYRIPTVSRRQPRPSGVCCAQGSGFIDCGIGVYRAGESPAGIVRTTTCTPERQELHRLPVVDDADDDEYNNIQVADLNALNAIHAVIKWKKLFGFYADLEHEHHSAYTVDGNHLSDDDQSQ